MARRPLASLPSVGVGSQAKAALDAGRAFGTPAPCLRSSDLRPLRGHRGNPRAQPGHVRAPGGLHRAERDPVYLLVLVPSPRTPHLSRAVVPLAQIDAGDLAGDLTGDLTEYNAVWIPLWVARKGLCAVLVAVSELAPLCLSSGAKLLHTSQLRHPGP